MKWAVKLLKFVIVKLSSTFRTTVDAFKNIREQPFDSLRGIMFGFTLAVVLLNLVVSVIVFAIQGGFANQISAITDNSASNGLNAAFQMGNQAANLFLNGILWRVSWVLIAAQVLLLIFFSFWSGNLTQRIIIAIDSVFALILGLCAAVFQGIDHRIIHLSQKQEARLVELFHRSGQTIITVFFALCAAASICFIIIVLLKVESRIALKHIIISIFISYLVCPAILFLIGNIVPLVCSIVLALIFGGIFYFVVSRLADSSGGDSSSSSTPTKRNMKPQPQVKSWTIPSGIQVRKVHGSMHDYVERYNSLEGRSEVCSLNDLRNGKFIIIDPRKGRLKENDIPWK